MGHIIEIVERVMIPDVPTIDLPSEDGLPLETNWHRIQINQLVDSVRQLWQGKTDFFAGGNMFVYFSAKQARNRDYKGPDFFVAKNVEARDRRSWIVWEEDGRFPNVIVELLSPTTADADLGSKKTLYEQTFKTPEYFCYDPDLQKLRGWRLGRNQTYEPLEPNEQGHLRSDQLGVWLGMWEGEYQGIRTLWLRLFENSQVIPTGEEAERERTETEHQRAETERRRAEAAEARIADLQRELERERQKNSAS